MILEIDGTYAGIKFSACHFIPGEGKCSRLHGHSYVVRVRIEGDAGTDGKVMDFVGLKKKLRELADVYDHRVLLPGRSDDVILTVGDTSVEAVCGQKRYSFPSEDVIVLDVMRTTAEEIAVMIADRLSNDIEFPSNVRSLSVGIDEERGQTAWYTRVL